MSNLYTQVSSVSSMERQKLLGQTPKVLWLTGLSGSGKSTIADALDKKLYEQGRLSYILDGDNIRQGLNKDLSFSNDDRTENIRRVSEAAKLLLDAGVIVITAFISPFTEDRAAARKIIGETSFVEVFVDTPLEICEQRDVKGLYKKARAGEIPSFTGISSPYESPENPEILVNTFNQTVEESTQSILSHLKHIIK